MHIYIFIYKGDIYVCKDYIKGQKFKMLINIVNRYTDCSNGYVFDRIFPDYFTLVNSASVNILLYLIK